MEPAPRYENGKVFRGPPRLGRLCAGRASASRLGSSIGAARGPGGRTACVFARSREGFASLGHRRRDIDAAGRHADQLQRAYARTPRWLRADAAAEAAFWFAYVKTDVATARQYLSDARGLFTQPCRRLIAEAAVAVEDGDFEGARSLIGRSTAAITCGIGTVSDLDIEQLDAIRLRLAERQAV